MANIWESQAGAKLVEDLSTTLGELRDYMKTQNEINKALLNQVTALKEEVVSLHNNKQDKTVEIEERE